MKKILFILPSYNIGGINTSLINLLSVLNKENLDISIYVCNPTGVLKDKYREYNILPSNRLFSLLQPFSRDENLYWYLIKHFTRVILKLFRTAKIELIPLIYKRAAIQISKGNYDAVIALQEGPVTHFTSYFKTRVLAAWIHCMYERYFEEKRFKSEAKIYSKFDKVISVSDSACKSFINIYPQYAYKTVCVYNCIDNNAIRLMSEDQNNISSIFKSDIFTIISVGRIDPIKQFSKIPEIARKLVDANIKFRWYVLGAIADKNEYQILMCNIQQLNVQDKVILLEATPNPYFYIANSALMVCTSISESFNYTLSEAKVLHIPVVSTDFECAKEFIQDNLDGFISPIEEIHLMIENLISNKSVYEEIKNNIKYFNYSNEHILEKFMEIIND